MVVMAAGSAALIVPTTPPRASEPTHSALAALLFASDAPFWTETRRIDAAAGAWPLPRMSDPAAGTQIHVIFPSIPISRRR